ILHLPHVLYHARPRPARQAEAGPRPPRRGLAHPPPGVLAIIPTRDRPELLDACVAGLLGQTAYAALDLCIVDNGSRTPQALGLLSRLEKTPRVRVMRIDAP